MDDTAAPEEGAKQGGKKRTALIAVLIAIALLAVGIGAWSVWKANSAKGDAGATVTSYEGMTKEEIQADLDRKANESRMTISVADAVKIVNKSVFPIHVTNVTAAEQSPFKLVADVSAGTDTNAIQFNLKNGATDIAAATGMNTAALENFDMGYAGAANDNLTFDVNATQGKIARTTVDLSSAQKAATVSWTVAAGSHANA